MSQTMRVKFLGVIALTMSTMACSTTPPIPQPLIPTYQVINSVKCGLSRALMAEQTEEPKFRRLTGNIATVELELKVVTNSAFGGGAGVSTSGVLPYNAAINASASKATQWTVDSLINASYKLDATNDAVCAAAEVGGVHADPDPLLFSNWLGSTIDDLGRVSLEKPTGVLSKLTYEAAFGLTKMVGGGAKVGVAFLNFDIEASRSRADTQRLKVIISSPDDRKAPAAPAAPPPLVSSGHTGAGGLGPLSVIVPLSRATPLLK